MKSDEERATDAAHFEGAEKAGTDASSPKKDEDAATDAAHFHRSEKTDASDVESSVSDGTESTKETSASISTPGDVADGRLTC